MTKQSGNHAQASQSETGEWHCDFCGAEAVDFDIFEEAGVYEKCIESANAGDTNSSRSTIHREEVEKAQAWIKASSLRFQEIGEAANRSSVSMKELAKRFLDVKITPEQEKRFTSYITWTETDAKVNAPTWEMLYGRKH